MLKPKDKKRFYAKINKGEPDDCWPWSAGRNKGYGRFRLNKKLCNAHRIAYLLATGEQPGNLCVLHSCDNRACCNPAHLRLGTYADNMRDKAERGRNPLAKLTEKEVLEILDQLQHPCRGQQSDLAKKYGVTRQTISLIKVGQTWSHLQPSISIRPLQPIS